MMSHEADIACVQSTVVNQLDFSLVWSMCACSRKDSNGGTAL